MKKFLLMLAVAAVALSMGAAPVDQMTAQRKAKQFMASGLYAGQIMASSAENPVLVKTEMGNKVNQPALYIYNTASSFIVVAGDDRAEEILMVGDRPLSDINNLPLGLQDMLSQYRNEISFLQEHPDLKVDPIVSPINTPSLRAVTYGPLLTCNWDQEAPFNNQCKFTYNNRTYTCLTGCPATSASQVMYYWKYPTQETGTVPAYTGTLNTSSSNNSNYDVDYTYDELPSVTFDWVNMKNSYSSYTTAQGNAVATLMRYVGQAEKMGYGVGASGISAYDAADIVSMFKRFGYNSSTVRLVRKVSLNTGSQIFTDAQWAAMIQEEMAAGRPIVFMASGSSGGHAFNVDGYRDSDNKYHCNFGWSGDGNAWCALNSFGYSLWGQSSTFNEYQQMVIGIAPTGQDTPTPDPVLTVTPTTLSFTGETGSTYTQTFTVTGTDLQGDVTMTVGGTNPTYYSVSPSTLTAAQAQAGATVTVTYNPTVSGTTSATVTIASANAVSKTVNLAGTSTTVRKITVDPTSLEFSTEVGTTVSKTFRLKGVNLNNAVMLSVSGTGFSINKTNVTRVAANNGIDVTVTFSPSASGTFSGEVTLTSTGVETVTLPLTGTAISAPVITANPTSLNFTTTVGNAVTKTFTVTGTDLTGNVSLAVSGAGYTINKTNITKAEATNGATVTVTYNPTASGSHAGTVTLTSEGAQPVTVNLNGTATTIPALSVNPTSLSMNAVVGTPVTKTFTVTGSNLTNGVTLAVSGTGFAIDKTNITQSAAANGATVTVTYNPTAAGNHTGTVTVTSNGAQTVTVALSGTATEPVRAINVNPTSLNLTALTGETATATFNVSGENLNGNLTLSLTGGNGVYSISPTTISAADAMAGNVPVTVTYAPNAYGVQNAVVNITGGGAPAASVALYGTATLAKFAPVMLPAIEQYIGLTKFRADWTNETPDANVDSYTLEVTSKPTEIPVALLGTLDGTVYTGSYVDITLSAPWGGQSVRGGNNAVYVKNNYNGVAQGNITFTIPEGYNNAPFTVKITTATGNYGSGNVTVSTPQTEAVGYNFPSGQTHTWLVTASAGEKITIFSTDNGFSPDITRIEVYSGDATASAMLLAAVETGDENSRTITGITDKFYTVENLAAEGSFLYRVKAKYIDGTESDWSNVEEVTLFGPAYQPGDVNHDGFVNITDVSVLITYILNDDGDIFLDCADYNGDNNVNISDVMDMITFIVNTR